MKTFIYLPIEVKVRELWPKIWLAAQLADRGFSCILGDKPGVKRAMGLYPPGIYFDKSISPRKEMHLREILKSQHVVVCQDEESGLARSDIKPFFDERISKETLSTIERFYCWGVYDYKYLTRCYADSAHKFVKTGASRTDFWRLGVAEKVYREKIEKIRAQYGRYILVNSSIGITSSDAVERRLHQSLDYGLISENNIEATKKKLLQRLEEFYRFAYAVEYLATVNPEINIVVRPHPSENPADWNKVLQRRNNLTVVRDDDVTPWIAGSLAIIHEGCTTALQAVAMNIPVITYLFDSTDDNKINGYPLQFGISATTGEELSESVRVIMNNHNEIKSNNAEQLKERIDVENVDYAAFCIALDLSELDVPQYDIPRYWPLIIYREYTRLRTLKKRITNLFTKDNVVVKTKIPGGIKTKEVRKSLKMLERLDPSIARTRVKSIGTNVVEISSRY